VPRRTLVVPIDQGRQPALERARGKELDSSAAILAVWPTGILPVECLLGLQRPACPCTLSSPSWVWKRRLLLKLFPQLSTNNSQHPFDRWGMTPSYTPSSLESKRITRN